MKNIISSVLLSIVLIQVVYSSIPVCPIGEKSNPSPDTAQDVYLSDIEFIFTLGDTISAGFLAKDTKFTGTNEYRGISFINGNETDAWTLLNIFSSSKNEPLIGGSQTLINGARQPGVYYSEYDGFNGATRGRESYIASEARFVIGQGNKLGVTDLNNRWKMVNVYIGLYKACSACFTVDEPFQTNFRFWMTYFNGVISDITEIFNEKVIINFIGLPKLSQFYSTSSLCKSFNQNNGFCPCLYEESTDLMDEIIVAANQGLMNSIHQWKRQVDQSTTTVGIVYQPFLTSTNFNPSLVSSVDCIHPNEDGHKLMAIGLWNNIREYDSKSTSVTLNTPLNCESSPLHGIYNPNSNY